MSLFERKKIEDISTYVVVNGIIVACGVYGYFQENNTLLWIFLIACGISLPLALLGWMFWGVEKFRDRLAVEAMRKSTSIPNWVDLTFDIAVIWFLLFIKHEGFAIAYMMQTVLVQNRFGIIKAHFEKMDNYCIAKAVIENEIHTFLD